MTDYKTIIQKSKPEIEERISHLKEEMLKIRADRATPHLVEDIIVDCYNQKLPLKQLAAISCPGQRQITIQPWDKNYTKDIISAIHRSGSDLNPTPENDVIRINLPPLTEEYRNALLKTLSERREETRVEIKRIREKTLKEIQDKAKTGEIREDDKFKGKDELQKIIDEYNDEVDKVIESKEKEVKTV